MVATGARNGFFFVSVYPFFCLKDEKSLFWLLIKDQANDGLFSFSYGLCVLEGLGKMIEWLGRGG